ncbi:CDP-glycerol glycerophosphotransferase family protein [Aestuariibacter halophilus]|uniref:CDP-glycerol glycerophosphotransferase family protein n=1 Tax=Fluctibacter halophilus TaxID=226011 RepID=A0ABS8GA94_9ALTE|nr:CDP-glycerol glycerophosphotransferase family protein [Aestuariibacter halophilus]MCC2617512.1 CDP-glycerol glycerophosphotransferase family protein [Aestuariibacter halophilus]
MRHYLFYIGQNYSFEILRPLQAEAQQRGDKVAWFVEGSDVNLDYFEPHEQRLTSVGAIRAFKPDAVFVPGNLVPRFIPGLKVQVFHGFEWKKKGHFRMRSMFDLYCTQGPLFTQRFIQMRDADRHFNVVETGWPKVDVLFDAEPYTWSSRNDKPVILFAPTFSPALTSAPALYDEIARLIETKDWQWLIKFHPKMDTAWIERYRELTCDTCHIVDTPSLAPVLKAADLMVSDTSSIITEFALLGRPVVTFKNRDPEPHLIDIHSADALEDAIANHLHPSEKHLAAIRDNVAQLHPYQDGQSSARMLNAVEYMLSNGREGLKPMPRNVIRNFKLRKKLGYWGV